MINFPTIHNGYFHISLPNIFFQNKLIKRIIIIIYYGSY